MPCHYFMPRLLMLLLLLGFCHDTLLRVFVCRFLPPLMSAFFHAFAPRMLRLRYVYDDMPRHAAAVVLLQRYIRHYARRHAP